jgi:hypothetical protein
MSAKPSIKQVFELTGHEFNFRLKEKLDEVLKLHADKNLPRVYRNELCVKKNQFIHEYPNGKKFLIEQDQINSEEIILREL